MPALAAADAIFTAAAESTLHAELHWWVGAVPVVPFSAVKPAPVLLSVTELAASVAPALTYEFAASDPQALAPFEQYCLSTALLPALLSPFTVTFQPDPLPVASATENPFIVPLSVCN